jgi:hypothetical protein
MNDALQTKNMLKILPSDMCIHSHFKIKSSSHAVRNIIPSNNSLGVKKIVIFLVTVGSTLFMLNLSIKFSKSLKIRVKYSLM